ncbi:AAA family ATPase [Sphingomonas sp. CFBP 13706]|uniref:AAA family ATPase n=1 Tax=Sphingomonas sp. CFBP 13706 TaxID=2775314 RepID=UPI001784E397|nr:ATP-binding protein [Sphingomonas sp. CFBP 13706]MBD8735334.1 ATP-binding protein [Sphingomonas sp. CFBP 13706]
MSKGQSVRRLRSAGGTDGDLRETFTALIQEAHNQRRHRPNLQPAPTFTELPSMAMVPLGMSSMLPEALQSLLREVVPRRRLTDLVLQKSIRDEVLEFVLEVSETALLRSHSLEPRHTIMLVGPPGTGKTSLAEAVATELALPFLTVRYEGLVGSYLGETASRLQQIIDYVARTPCVLFFDEFDSVGKERADQHETGEIKRVVSSLLLHMDALPSHCIVVCATNHPELLDRAVWRRFEMRIELPRPGVHELREWYMRTEKAIGSLGLTSAEFVGMFTGETFSEIEAVVLDAKRKMILSRGKKASADAFKEAIAAWRRRRTVGEAPAVGSRSNRKNKPGARNAASDTGASSPLPAGDLL